MIVNKIELAETLELFLTSFTLEVPIKNVFYEQVLIELIVGFLFDKGASKKLNEFVLLLDVLFSDELNALQPFFVL